MLRCLAVDWVREAQINAFPDDGLTVTLKRVGAVLM